MLYKRFRANFPILDCSVVTESALKNEQAKEIWRGWMIASQGIVLDHDMMSLVRVNCEFPYEQWNTIMVSRMQFYCIELARNKEGLNEKVRTDHLTETIIADCHKLSDALSKSSMHAAHAILDNIARHTVLCAQVLRESQVGKAMKKLSKYTKDASIAAKAAKMTEQWRHGITLLKTRDNAAKAGDAALVEAMEFALARLQTANKQSVGAPISAQNVDPEKRPKSEDLHIACEKASDASPLPTHVVEEATACLLENGVCYFDDVLPDGFVAECKGDAEANVHKVKGLLKELDLDLLGPQKFDFAEVRQRKGKRIDVRLGVT